MKTFKIVMTTGVALMVLMLGGQASANSIDTFSGFPVGTFTQQDKNYSGFTDLNGNYNALNNITTITTQTFGAPPFDVHTVSFGGLFSTGLVYDIKYTITVNNPSLFINKIGVGIDQSFGTTSTVQKIGRNAAGVIVYDSGNVSGNVGDFTLAIPLQTLSIEDIITVGQSKVNSVTNSVTETGTTPTVPEPATMLLLGFGLIGLAGAQRKFKK